MLSWDTLYGACLTCGRCGLCEERTNVVVGDGSREADIMFIGEGPGFYEDQKGIPFVGKAGQLLDKMLASVELDRSKVYITNVVKCRPPNNRDPLPAEQEACLSYLRYQLKLVEPKIVVALGRISAKVIIDKDFRITRDRGIWHDKKGYRMIATYHPSALLRDEEKKRPAWEDFKSIKAEYDKFKGNA